MADIRNMNSSDNTIEIIKEKFKRGVLEQYKKFIETGDDREFNREQIRICSDGSIGTPRWAIVSRKNFFGLGAELGNEIDQSVGKLFLKANGGRFRIECCPFWFPKKIDISDILQRSEEKQYSEITDFYNMNNRQLFETFGVALNMPDRRKLAAECLLLDSLLKGKYEEIKDIFCHNLDDGQSIDIELQDGTKIMARDNDKGIIIKQGNKEASVNFDGIYNKKDKKDRIMDNINNLDVKDVVYSGDEQLIGELKTAMSEQFESQRIQDVSTNETFPYQEALDLFEQSYFPEGITCAKDWNIKMVLTAFRNTLDNSYLNRVTGKNAFSPYIAVNYGKEGKEKYELSLHKGKFLGLGNGNADAPMCKNSIDITDMSKDEIVSLVKNMLSMTNEQVLEQFKPDLIDDRLIVSLILDDEIQRYFESSGVKVTDTLYMDSDYINYSTEDGRKIYIYSEKDLIDGDNSKLNIKLSATDEINVRIDNKFNYIKNGSIASIQITDLQEHDFTDNELHKRITETLQSRFMNRKLDTNTKISHQDILDLVTENGRTGLTKLAEQKIVDTAKQNINSKENEQEKTKE